MFIPTWLIVVVIIIGIYYFAKWRKVELNLNNIYKRNFSYKLDIHIEPNWYNLYKNLCNPISEKMWEKSLSDKINASKKDDGSINLWGRQYYFTEFYDSSSGLMTRFQRVICYNGKQYFYPVDEFRDRGFVFDIDSASAVSENQDEMDTRDKLSIEIGENFIRNDIYDKCIGGPRPDFDYEEENYLFNFPLYEVFSFLFALGQRFHNAERHNIIKWPDQIEQEFKKSGIEYETYFEYEPEPFDIKKRDKKFFDRWASLKFACIATRILLF